MSYPRDASEKRDAGSKKNQGIPKDETDGSSSNGIAVDYGWDTSDVAAII
jgi:hypothetical protein